MAMANVRQGSAALYVCFSKSPPWTFWQQPAAMQLYVQDSAHSDLILAKLFLALLPTVCPSVANPMHAQGNSQPADWQPQQYKTDTMDP